MPATDAWFFDEIHKYRAWRNYLKGLYDAAGGRKRILVTGSARLDFYRFGGDSLQGRYFYFRLHPLSLAEVGGRTPEDLAALLELSGFPEPFLGGSATEARRWSLAYRERLIRDEVTSLESISDLGKLELLALTLPSRVGSPLSVNALREDLQVSHATVARWLDVLERLYAIFRVPPFGAPRLRAVKKEQKHYHFDWTVVSDSCRTVREPGCIAPAEMGQLSGGHAGPRRRAAVLPGYRRSRGRLRPCPRRARCRIRRVQVGRRGRVALAALPSAALSGRAGLAGKCGWEEGLRDAPTE